MPAQNLVAPLPRSPLNNSNMAKITEEDEPDFPDLPKTAGIENRSFHSSNNSLSIPMRKSTSDLFLPPGDPLSENAKSK